MSGTARDVYGNAPDSAATALVIVDMINHLEFDGGDRLEPQARAAGEAVAALRRRAREACVPIVYANDNFGRWRSDFHQVIDECTAPHVRGRRLGRIILPDEDDYFVLKPKHSAFYDTTLNTLLHYLGAKTLILTGIAGEACVLQTASDAYMRDYRLIVPRDCTASIDPADNDSALSWMERNVKADTSPSDGLTVDALAALRTQPDVAGAAP